MKDGSSSAEDIMGDIAWHQLRDPGDCEHDHKVIAVISNGGLLRRCVKCGSLEDL